MKTTNKLMLQCDCHGEILICEEDSHTFDNSERYQQTFSFGFFTHGTYIEKPNLWWRIKYAFWHLRTGKIYHDYIELDDKKAEALAKYLKENIEKFRPSSI